MTSSPACEGDSGTQEVRSLMGSNSSSTTRGHRLPVCSGFWKRTYSLAKRPYSESSRRRDPAA
eukprot:306857-Pyramimonas_sp.AAC.1